MVGPRYRGSVVSGPDHCGRPIFSSWFPVKDSIAMKKIMYSLLPLIICGCCIGCANKANQGCRDGCNGGCNRCGVFGGNAMTANGQPCGPLGGHFMGGGCPQNPRAYVGPAGPPTAAVTYPYYTTRGPRDFLLDQPQTIGP